MFWPFRKTNQDVPNYSPLKATPSRGLPADLKARENDLEHSADRDRVQAELRQPGRLPDDETPMFFSSLPQNGRGLVTLQLPDQGPCLVTFSTPLRAADYVRTAMSPLPEPKYLSATAPQFVQMLGDLRRESTVTHIALDRCPRCNIFSTVGIDSVVSPDQAKTVWSIYKATEIARCQLYLDYAVSAARRGQTDLARDVALELVGHVTLEAPQVHLLLGMIGIRLRDRTLLREAKAYLGFLQQDLLVEQLKQAEASGVCF